MGNSIIYFGGSFNPPHISHYLFAAALCAYFPKMDIWIAPTFSHAFNKKLLPFELRIAMLEDIFAPLDGIKISQIEKELNQTPSYTIDVIRFMRRQGIKSKIYIAVGADIVPTVPQWRDYEALTKIARFLVFPREGYDNSSAVDMPHLPDISSSQLRTWLAEEKWNLVRPWMTLRAFERFKQWAERNPEPFASFLAGS